MVDTPDTKAAIEFLKRWSSNGLWALTAIQADRKAIATKTFDASTEEASARAWIEEYNGKRNIYFHVNPPLGKIAKKAEREDIKAVEWLHVDIDPRAGENLEEERERALALLTTKLPTSVPPPTVIVFSGGGYQGFWKLSESIPVNGELSRAEDAKRYNQQLEVLFGADNCHNIDRIMRLPGTINIPDVKKAKKGRQPILARLIEFNDLAYPLKDFTPAPVVQMPEERGFGAGRKTVQVSGNIERINDVHELDQWSVPDRVKIIIVQGKHPDEPKAGDNSRSAWIFDCICQLVRCEVPDDVIFSIITDPEFGISESVLDKGVNAEKYAIRQIERAKEEAIDPYFRQLNERHAVIGNIGGKCRIIEEVWDDALQRTRLTRQSFDDFHNRYKNIKVLTGKTPQGAPVMQPLGKFWTDHPQRRQFDTIVFCPAQEVTNSYNMWKGFAVPARPGNCELFLNHILSNICRGDEVLYNYLLGWMARAVQQPSTQGEVAIVLRGGRGVGKSFFAKHFGKLFGRHFLQVSNPSHLVGNFNSHLRDVIVLFADEAFYAGDKKHASILKTLITEDMLTIEAKGVDAEAAPNYVHLIMASNDEHVVPAGGDERRYLVVDVGNEHQQEPKYFSAIVQQLQNGGYEALLHFLMTYDISEFQVRSVPKTDALHDQKLLSLTPEEEWWYQRLSEGRTRRESDVWEEEVRKELLITDYLEHTDRFRVYRRGTQTALGKFLRRVCPELEAYQKMATWDEMAGDGFTRKIHRRTYFYRLPTLKEARARWEKFYGAENWQEPMYQPNLLPESQEKDVPF